MTGARRTSVWTAWTRRSTTASTNTPSARFTSNYCWSGVSVGPRRRCSRTRRGGGWGWGARGGAVMPRRSTPQLSVPPRPSRRATRRQIRLSSSRSPTDTRCTLPQVQSFLLHLASERGLADNSLHAYRRDLEDMDDHFREQGGSLVTASGDDFRAYLQDQSRRGQSTKTVSRRLAAIRVFLRYLAALGHDTTGILQQLERPKP